MNRIEDSARTQARPITVAVTFFADLRRYLPRGADGPQRYSLAEGATLADLLTVIGISPDAENVMSRKTTIMTKKSIMLVRFSDADSARPPPPPTRF